MLWRGAPAQATSPVGHGILLAGLTAANLWLGLGYGAVGAGDALSEIGVGVCFAVVGLTIAYLRPRSRTGFWMLGLGYLVLIANGNDFALPASLPGYRIYAALGAATFMVPYAVAAQIVLSYPSGRLTDRAERAAVVSGFVLALISGPVLLVTRTINHATCTYWCYDSPVQLITNRRLYLELRTANFAAWTVLAIVVLVLLARRAIRSTPRGRRVLSSAFALFGISVVFFIGYEITDGTTGYALVVVSFFYYANQWAAVLALTLPFLVGLLHEQLAFASIRSLLGRFEQVSIGGLQAALAEALRDPTLRVAFSTPDGLIDIAGKPYQPPLDTAWAISELGDPPLAMVIHDSTLTEYQELFDTAAGAARLALDNARLQTQITAQLAEVRASRQRIAAAADAERQRLERDLHDGAQQRLLGIGMTLGLLRGQLAGDAGHPGLDMIDELEHELHATIAELRDLAQGIRPTILTDQGLVPALAALARRAGTRVTLDLRVVERYDPVIEVTAYYVVSEALQNVRKHASSAPVSVSAVEESARLVIEVADRGPGGARAAAGTGLRGLADRVNAVGGELTITSPPSGGTRLRVELPCG